MNARPSGRSDLSKRNWGALIRASIICWTMLGCYGEDGWVLRVDDEELGDLNIGLKLGSRELWPTLRFDKVTDIGNWVGGFPITRSNDGDGKNVSLNITMTLTEADVKSSLHCVLEYTKLREGQKVLDGKIIVEFPLSLDELVISKDELRFVFIITRR